MKLNAVFLYGWLCSLFFVVIVLHSCQDQLDERDYELHNDSKIAAQTRSSICGGSPDSARLRINDGYSVLVTNCLLNDTIDEINYQLVASQSSDKYTFMDLRSDAEDTTATWEIIVFDNTINSLSTSNIYDSHLTSIPPGGPAPDYSCECTDDSETFDCWKENFLNRHYCYGNWCTACSVVIFFTDDSDEDHTYNETSAIILPDNQ